MSPNFAYRLKILIGKLGLSSVPACTIELLNDAANNLRRFVDDRLVRQVWIDPIFFDIQPLVAHVHWLEVVASTGGF